MIFTVGTRGLCTSGQSIPGTRGNKIIENPMVVGGPLKKSPVVDVWEDLIQHPVKKV